MDGNQIGTGKVVCVLVGTCRSCGGLRSLKLDLDVVEYLVSSYMTALCSLITKNDYR